MATYFIEYMILEKKCPKCKEIKYIRFFNKNKTKCDGLQSYCKVCALKASMNWNVHNREKCNVNANNWRARNPEKSKEISRRWRMENPEKARESWRKYKVKVRLKGFNKVSYTFTQIVSNGD